MSKQSKAKEALSGIYFDMEFISVYAPYCDAIFTDRTMYRWLSDMQKKSPNDFQFKVFSVENIGEFESYLNDIVNKKLSDLDEYLQLVYS